MMGIGMPISHSRMERIATVSLILPLGRKNGSRLKRFRSEILTPLLTLPAPAGIYVAVAARAANRFN
jgi:hypothetical protein